ncbi:hypothetical protein Ddye_007947 [Dipteronia dyeriana]|uniref:SCP domain-containing protein n=1 Tax=Dipteronia dyeriana TaxID=168575 RepID=A0AAD9XKW9_9ROSI|nr:hypothetical protein Ddye_007947 [Dipteronia dyeriana]
MEIKSLFTYTLLATSLLFCSFNSITFSLQSTFHQRILYKPTGARAHNNNDVIQEFLAPHNIVRARLGLPPLKWSKKLARFASWWAGQRRRDCALVHSGSDYGENMFWGSGKDWKPSDAVATWAEERSYYDHKSNRCVKNRECLHYTQMVWKQSLKVGCAQTVCENANTIITCNYYPHGNVIGQKPF